MRAGALLAAWLLTWLATVGCRIPLPGQSTRVPSGLPLFNGHDLSGWRTWLVDTGTADPRGVFTVRNGELCLSGDGLGYVGTVDEHANYHLHLEYRWDGENTHWGDRRGRARDSGVFVHATGPDGNSEDGQGAFMAALECNVFEGATGDLLLIRGRHADGSPIHPRVWVETAPGLDPDGWVTWQPGGVGRQIERWGRVNWRHKSPDWRDVTGFRGARDIERPTGEWNRLRIEAEGDQLRFVLNGITVNEVRDVNPRRGRILLQCEGSPIRFRNLVLEPRPASGSSLGLATEAE